MNNQFVRDVPCKECGRKGTLILTFLIDGEIEVEDKINHKIGCSLKAKKPKHLKSRTKWMRGERQGNALVGAKATAGSGNVGKDGDGRILNEWRVETKTTEKGNYRLTKAVWEKLIDGALSNMEEPVFFIKTKDFKVVVVRRGLLELHYDSLVIPKVKSAEKSINIKISSIAGFPSEIEGWKGSPVLLTESQCKVWFKKIGVAV